MRIQSFKTFTYCFVISCVSLSFSIRIVKQTKSLRCASWALIALDRIWKPSGDHYTFLSCLEKVYLVLEAGDQWELPESSSRYAKPASPASIQALTGLPPCTFIHVTCLFAARRTLSERSSNFCIRLGIGKFKCSANLDDLTYYLEKPGRQPT
ncbi:hypothetical protein IG631_15548 [Alternaria alternata]|nr:hypothetical protein IG631_15548 [Alternaria alternata]